MKMKKQLIRNQYKEKKAAPYSGQPFYNER